MVDFGSEQGLSDFETTGIARYFEDFKRAKTQLRAERCHFWMDTSYNLRGTNVKGKSGFEFGEVDCGRKKNPVLNKNKRRGLPFDRSSPTVGFAWKL